MTTKTPTAQAAPSPRIAPVPSTPTPTQHELDGFVVSMTNNTLPPIYSHAMDGSTIDPKSFDPTPKTSSWP